MRKLILATAIALLSTAAFADGPRGLSMPQPAIQPATEQQMPLSPAKVTILPGPAEQPAVTSPPQSMEEKLKAAGELKPDGTPANDPLPRVQTPVAPAPVPTRATAETAPAPAPVQAARPAHSRRVAHAHTPARKRMARHDSTERQFRRIAARFGIYW